MKKAVALSALGILLSAPLWAATRVVTLSVSGITCAACPITVRKALSRVHGVEKVVVHYEKRQVIVTFDDAKTNIPALTQATKNAGYPSTVQQESRR